MLCKNYRCALHIHKYDNSQCVRGNRIWLLHWLFLSFPIWKMETSSFDVWDIGKMIFTHCHSSIKASTIICKQLLLFNFHLIKYLIKNIFFLLIFGSIYLAYTWMGQVPVVCWNGWKRKINKYDATHHWKLLENVF